MDTIPNEHPGLLIVRIFVAKPTNPPTGRPVRLAVIPCTYGEVQNVLALWKAANNWLPKDYSSPLDARFELGNVIIE